MNTVLVVNGPNINLLGAREPETYGDASYSELESSLNETARELSVKLLWQQSNHEGQLIDFIHEHGFGAAAMIINPGALGHYSYALRDAIAAIGIPTIEVHLTHVQAREEFRHRSVLAPVCSGLISGLHFDGYRMALLHLVRKYHLDRPVH